jgi:hypothetical protein
MDTSKVKTDSKQEAEAGLLQLDQRPTTASSEEDRLAAGISTIGLQARKLSGAQRKKRMRERKMREGTWTESKHPRKTPPSQDRGVVGSSGGVKRPHSDSSTPSTEQQQPKKSRSTLMQTKTHKKAATGIKMVIIHRRHPNMTLDQNQADIIQEKVSDLVDVNPVGEAPPQFLHSRFAQGILTNTCANEFTKAWLMRVVERLGELWESMELKVVDFRDLPKRPRVLVRIPGNMEVTKVVSRLRTQNPGLNTVDWAVMSRKVVGRKQTLALSIDSIIIIPGATTHVGSWPTQSQASIHLYP